MNRIGRDDVELVLRGQDKVAGVVVEDLGARVVEYVVVFVREVFGGGRWDQGLQFADRDFLNGGMDYERPRGYAGAEADDQDRLRIPMQQRGNMAEHPLQAHVVGFGGRLHLSADVKVVFAVRQFGDRD